MIQQIPKKELINEVYYSGASTETPIAAWDEESGLFKYIDNNEIKSIKCFDMERPEEGGFFALIKIDNINIDVMRTGKLQLTE